MSDLSIYETFDGGDAVLIGNDLELTGSLFNQVYFALFGGNVEQHTEDVNPDALERFDWWANSLLFPDQPEKQWNSRTEKTLQEVVLNSSGIQLLNKAIKDDLSYLQELAEISFEVQVISYNKCRIDVFLKEPETLENRQFTFMWDATKQEEIIQREDVIEPPLIPELPNNLVVKSYSTIHVELSWDGNQEPYNIYESDVLIGQSTSESFTENFTCP